MKHGVSSYSYSPYLADGRMDLKDVIRSAAEIGFEGVELANIVENYSFDLDELRKTASDAGIRISSWATSADFTQDIPEQKEALIREMDMAQRLGCDVFRTDIYHEDVPDPYAEKVVKAVYELAGKAEERGLVLTTENHGGFLCTPERLDLFINMVGHPNFGLLCDFANFADAGVSPQTAVGLLAPRVRHVHMKDVHILSGELIYPGEGWYVARNGDYTRCAITGQGNLPLFSCVKALAAVGYEGWLIQEFEGLEDCVYAVSQGLKYTKRLLEHLREGFWREGI